jgi:sugar phosphate permease
VSDAVANPAPAAASGGGASRARWGVSAILLLAVTTAFFDRINIAVLFGNRDFQAAVGVSQPALMGLLMTAFVFPYGASAMLFSVGSDLFGPRKTLAAIAALLAGTMAFMGTISSYGLMIAARIVIGVTEGPQFGTATAAVKRWFPAREQALANALWTIGSPLGSMIGFPLVIFLVAQYGWRASFFALAALNALVVLPVIWFFLRDSPPDTTLSAPKEPPIPFGQAFAMLARDWRFWMLPAFNSGTLIYLWGINSWLPTYLQARQFDLAAISFYSALPFALMIPGQILFAWLGDRTRQRAAVCCATQILTGVFVYLATRVADASLAAWLIAISAFFWGGVTPPLFAISTEIIPRRITAAGFGLFAGFANLMGSSAPFVIGTLVGITGDFQAGLIFLVAALIATSFAMVPLIGKH